MASKKHVQATIGHVGIEVTNLRKSKKFYKTLLSKLGLEVLMETENALGLSNQNFQVWVSEPAKPRVKRDSPSEDESIVADHLAILVPDKSLVDAVDREMAAEGFKALFPCGEYPEFCPGYYAVSFYDRDNNVIEVYTRPKTP